MLAVLPLGLQAQEAAAVVRPVPVGGESLLTVLLSLLAVLLLIVLLAWIARRLQQPFLNHQAVRVLAVLPLGQRERAVLVSLGGQQLLLGVAPGQVRLLYALKDPLPENPQQNQVPFTELLQKVMARRDT